MTSILEWKNTAHITKAGMEAGFAIASLSMAIVAIAIHAGTTLPAFLGFTALFANPFGIAALALIDLYFTVQAISSY